MTHDEERLANDAYNEFILKMDRLTSEVHCMVIVDECTYLIDEDYSHILAVVKKHDEQPRTGTSEYYSKVDIVSANSESFPYYPEIILLPDDYESYHVTALSKGVLCIDAFSGGIRDGACKSYKEKWWRSRKGV